MKVTTYDIFGAKKGTAEVSEKVFGAKWNADLVHQVIVSMQSNLRAGTAHTKDRSEVSGGGKKPWRQKGTGRARHGSRRSPIWRTGGVTFGPRNEKDYSKKINTKMRRSALVAVLSAKLGTNNILFVDSIDLNNPKTKEAMAIMNGFAKVEGFDTLNTKSNLNNALIVVSEINDNIKKAFANLPHVTLIAARELDALTTAKARYVIVVDPSAISDIILARLETRSKKETLTAEASA